MKPCLKILIRDELKEIRSKFDVPRITQIEDDYDDIDIEDLIPNENMVVTITHQVILSVCLVNNMKSKNEAEKEN